MTQAGFFLDYRQCLASLAARVAEPAIGRDIVALAAVRRPALLR
jgi:hypothetical protein